MSDIRLIDQPEAKSSLRAVTELVLTILIWCVWLYLFIPLLQTVTWYLSEQGDFSSLWFGGLDSKTVMYHLLEMKWVLLFCFVIVPVWVGRNIVRYRKNNRRHRVPSAHVETEDWLADYHQLPSTLLQSLQDQKEVVWRDGMTECLDAGQWLKEKGHGNQPSAPVAVPESNDEAPVEPSLRKAVWTAVGITYLLAIVIWGIRLYEGMPGLA